VVVPVVTILSEAVEVTPRILHRDYLLRVPFYVMKVIFYIPRCFLGSFLKLQRTSYTKQHSAEDCFVYRDRHTSSLLIERCAGAWADVTDRVDAICSLEFLNCGFCYWTEVTCRRCREKSERGEPFLQFQNSRPAIA
jgi:hypothetical protein